MGQQLVVDSELKHFLLRRIEKVFRIIHSGPEAKWSNPGQATLQECICGPNSCMLQNAEMSWGWGWKANQTWL